LGVIDSQRERFLVSWRDEGHGKDKFGDKKEKGSKAWWLCWYFLSVI
jgi:hypothetical protein